MIKFRQKSFASVAKYGKQGLDWVKKNPGVPLSVASLGLLIRNTRVNDRARHDDSGYKVKQLESMNRLTSRLDKMSGSLEATRGSLDATRGSLENINNTMSSHLNTLKNATVVPAKRKKTSFRRANTTDTNSTNLWGRIKKGLSF